MSVTEKRTVIIEVPCLPPASGSLNSRACWQVRARERKKFMMQVGYAAVGAGIKDENLMKVKAMVEIELVVKANRRRDPDNLTGLCYKPVMDSLVCIGLLADDSQKYVSLKPVVVTVDPKRAPRTIIRVWELLV